MPRVSAAERVARDRLIFDLWVAGLSERAIASHPGVQLARGNVHEVLVRECEAVDVIEQLEEHFAAAYPAACAGDVAAGARCRRLGQRLARLAPPPEDESPLPEWPQPVKQLQRFKRDPKYFPPKARRR